MSGDGDGYAKTDQFLADIVAEMTQTNSSSAANETSNPVENEKSFGICNTEYNRNWSESSQRYPGIFKEIPNWEFAVKVSQMHRNKFVQRRLIVDYGMKSKNTCKFNCLISAMYNRSTNFHLNLVD
jgi:hypothetical protein